MWNKQCDARKCIIIGKVLFLKMDLAAVLTIAHEHSVILQLIKCKMWVPTFLFFNYTKQDQKRWPICRERGLICKERCFTEYGKVKFEVLHLLFICFCNIRLWLMWKDKRKIENKHRQWQRLYSYRRLQRWAFIICGIQLGGEMSKIKKKREW